MGKQASDEYELAATFFQAAIQELGALEHPPLTKVLDIGTGSGRLVNRLAALGYDAYGCDVSDNWQEESSVDFRRFSQIALDPYRLPYEDSTFNVVISTSVLEHAQNKEALFLEVRRVLKPGGYSMHLFPSKWYLPVEPHIYVPLVNFFWPRCPKWWLALWALMGVRNEFEQGKSWRDVLECNWEYCRDGLSYWPNSAYQKLSMKVFGNCSVPMTFYINHSYGGLSKRLRKFPFQPLIGWAASQFRMNFIVQQKLEAGR